MTTSEKVLGFGHHRLLPDENSVAGYGARLIYGEVKDGYAGVVWDRQSVFGDKELIEKYLFPVVKKWTAEARAFCKSNWNGSASYDIVRVEENVTLDLYAIVQGSPQGSCGYFYVTALLQKREEYEDG